MNSKAFLLVFIILLLPCIARGAVHERHETVYERLMKEQSDMDVYYGHRLLSAGQYARAAEYFRSAVKKNPYNSFARTGLGAVLYWEGQLEKARDEFSHAIELDPENATAYQLRGIVLARAGLYEEALSDNLIAVKKAPERGDIRMNTGTVYAVLGDMQKALYNYRRAVALDRYNPLFHFQLARCYEHMLRDEEAAAELRRAIAIYPGYEDAVFELASLRERNGALKEAEKLFRRAVSLKPRDSVARFRLAAILYETGRVKDIPGVVLPGFLIAPANNQGGISMGIAYSSSENVSGSSSYLTESEKSTDINSSRKTRGGTRAEEHSPEVQENDARRTVKRIGELLSRVPENQEIRLDFEMIEIPRVKLNVVSVSEGNKKNGKMSAALARPGIQYNKKTFYLPAATSTEREKDIIRIAEEAEGMLASVSPDMDARVKINMETGTVAGAAGGGNSRYDGGRQNNGSMARYIPRDVGNDMGLWISGEGWIESAAETLDRLSEKKEDSYELRLVRGLGYLIMGETSAALADFSNGGPVADTGRAAAYTAAGNIEAAIKACTEALRRDPGNKIAGKNLKWLKLKPASNKNNNSGGEKMAPQNRKIK